MNAQAPVRGTELVGGGGPLAARPGWLARLLAPSAEKLINRIDGGIVRGTIDATLPDGSTRRLGGRAAGFHAHVTLHSWRALLRLATSGSVGCYLGWDAGEWESPDPVVLFALFMDNALSLGDAGRAHGPWRLTARFMHWLRRNTRFGSLRNIHAHYDLGNDFYSLWLDPTMSYSSGRFDGEVAGHEGAQRRKIAVMADRVAGARTLLEIGCGWGSLAGELAARGAHVTAISLSDQQLAWARQRLEPAVDFRKVDYRDVEGQYDAIVSVEMVEAVGREFWPDFFDSIARCLKPGGRAAIQFIAMGEELFNRYARSADFIQTYIFPGGMLIRESEFQRLAEERGLTWEDRAAFGLDYAETLRLWREAFDVAVQGGRLPAGFDDRFVRLWRFYLMYCEGGFRGGGIDVVQATLTKR